MHYNQTEIYLRIKIVIEHPPNMHFELFQIAMLCLILFFFLYVGCLFTNQLCGFEEVCVDGKL